MPDHVELRRGAYYDSVSLMQVSRAVAGAPGVDSAQVAMATELNTDLIRGLGFTLPDDVSTNDLVIAMHSLWPVAWNKELPAQRRAFVDKLTRDITR